MTALVGVLCAVLAQGADQEPLEVGSTVPALQCRDVRGNELSWSNWEERAVLLFFHSEDMAYSNQALQQVVAAFHETAALRARAALLVVTNGKRDVEALVELLDQAQVPSAITIDPERQQFQDYHVVAFPTAICVGLDRRIVHISKGYGPVFTAKVMAGVSLAAGLISREQYLKMFEVRQEAPRSASLLKLSRTIRMVRQLIAAGMLDEAREALAEVLEPDTDHAEGVGLLAAVLLQLGRSEDARTWIERLAAISPTSIELRYLRAELALTEQSPDRALEQLEGLDVTIPRVALLRGRALEAKGHYEEAAALYRRALEALLRSGH